MQDLYPLLIEPRYDERIWGGNNLATRLGKNAPRDRKIGESWEVYDGNTVLNGPYAGRTIADVRASMGRELTGHVDPALIFPLLTKLLDAQDVLSVQVHPNDAEAQSLEHQQYGKTECWYVIHAEPGAEIIYGFARDTSAEEYEKLVSSGGLNSILRSLPVHDHDVVYLPSRTLHAIGGGILVYELQQTSDITYRIYDWDRRDAEGHSRELHVDKAKQVLDFHRFDRGVVTPLSRPSDPRSVLVAGPYFTEELIDAGSTVRLSTYTSPVAVCALDTPISLAIGQEAVSLPAYSSAIIPAAAGECEMVPADGATEVKAIVAYVPTSTAATRADLLQRGYGVEQVDEFLQQFTPVS